MQFFKLVGAFAAGSGGQGRKRTADENVDLLAAKSEAFNKGLRTGAHKTVILKITIMASVRQGWQRNNGYLVKAGYPLFFCCHEKQ